MTSIARAPRVRTRAPASAISARPTPERIDSGVGRALIADAGARVRTLGARAIEVTGNEHALAFYEAVGFVRIGTAPTAGGDAPRLRLALG